ncbi:MAG: polyprenyl synthetase family protein [Chloroflexota bacterium]|nr:polyprenyl synthetase family protein [Chloroflexota bacterium]
MTMRISADRWLQAHPDELQTMLRFPLGWVDETGASYDRPAGKRIRPLLLLLCAEAAGGSSEHALPAAAAVELLHNFSLVHDDIQDDSDIRHGRPTVWRIWGKANAINAGDGLFAFAYAVLSEMIEVGVPAGVAGTVWQIFNATNLELIRGQYLDMRFETQSDVATSDYLSMIAGKSAALIAACAQMGALLGGADTQRADSFYEFGLHLGLAFQIRDDILGIWGDPALTGKSAATDILSRKKSLPILYGLERDARLKSLYQSETMTPEVVAEVMQLLDRLGASDYAKAQEELYVERAMDALSRANPVGAAAILLDTLTQQLLGRSA